MCAPRNPRLIEKVSPCRTPLHAAVEGHHLDAARVLLDSGANPSAQRHTDGATPLHIAAEKDNPDSMRLLLEYGSDWVRTVCCFLDLECRNA
eukprot:SAG31_NODE_2636_length_5337_cov_11.000955_2_plen_92_part_00